MLIAEVSHPKKAVVCTGGPSWLSFQAAMIQALYLRFTLYL